MNPADIKAASLMALPEDEREIATLFLARKPTYVADYIKSRAYIPYTNAMIAIFAQHLREKVTDIQNHHKDGKELQRERENALPYKCDGQDDTFENVELDDDDESWTSMREESEA